MRAGTIVASNYLEMAQLLGVSFLQHHPTGTFVVLLVDDLPISGLDARIEVMRLSDLAIPVADLDHMRTYYDVMELSTAVKPAFLSALLTDDAIACYLDPDIYVYAPFDDLVRPAADVGIVVTPHVLEPVPRDGLAVTERMIMQSGIFNLGFIAVGESGRRFLDWWGDRLLIDAVSDIEASLFTDQRWIDWVPALFDHHVCRDPGMNVAWWNIHERSLASDDQGLSSNGQTLRFVHYSGYDPTTPDRLSKHQHPVPRTEHASGALIRQLAEQYGAALLAAGHVERSRVPYQWATTADGLTMSSQLRRICRTRVLAGARVGCEAVELDRSIPPAFGEGSDSFRSWLTGADENHPDFTRAEVGIWGVRPDLQAAFPDPWIRDADRYRAWLDHDPGFAAAFPGLSVEQGGQDPIGCGEATRHRTGPSRLVRRVAPLPVRRSVRRLGGHTITNRADRISMATMGLRRRVAWMVRGPEYLERLQGDIRAVNQRIDQLQTAQDSQLDQIRDSVSDVLDDVMARVDSIDGEPAADQS